MFEFIKNLTIPRLRPQRNVQSFVFGSNLSAISSDVTESSIVESCMVALLSGINGGKLQVVNQNEEEVPHPALEMIDDALISSLVRSAYYCGNGIAAIVLYENSFQIAKLVYLPYKSVKVREPIRRLDGNPVFVYNEGGLYSMSQNLTTEEIVNFVLEIDMDKPWLGRSPLVTLVNEVKSDNTLRIFTQQYLSHMGQPGPIASPADNQNWTEEQAQSIEDTVNRFNAQGNAGRALAFRYKLDIKERPPIRQQVDTNAIAFIPESRIAGVMQVPAMIANLLVGMENTQTNATLREIRLQFAEQTIVPLQNKIANILTKQFLARFPFSEGLQFRYNNSRNPLFNVDKSSEWARVTNAYTNGLITKNEGRLEIGKEEVADGDVFFDSTPAVQNDSG